MQSALWENIRTPIGPVTRVVRRAGLSALGTYTAYVVHGLLHPNLLRTGVTDAERDDRLPGDELVARPQWVTDFAISIAATPEEVWPWLVQMGYGRAGWYTWFPLDNGGVPSADTIVPALQELAIGDVVPDGGRAQEGFGIWRVRLLETARALVLHSRRNPVSGLELTSEQTGACIDCSWAFVLAPTASGSRLHVRVRARLEGRLAWKPVATGARMLFGLGDNVMENTMLEGIRVRAERHAQRAAG